ncbi:hypothetical protein [Terrabacter sp. 2YAF2]|uniref:hypothetical protein n=1 Tax=Terrabacter sp. 2YAF2 TaxID=3233026 RepID=UPI003F965F0A
MHGSPSDVLGVTSLTGSGFGPASRMRLAQSRHSCMRKIEEAQLSRFSQWRTKNARSSLKIWRFLMPLVIVVISCGAVAGKLSGGFEAVAVAYVFMGMMFQMARLDAELPIRKRNLVFQP